MSIFSTIANIISIVLAGIMLGDDGFRKKKVFYIILSLTLYAINTICVTEFNGYANCVGTMVLMFILAYKLW